MSNVFYGNKSINEIDNYYGISDRKQRWKKKECEIIQEGFANHGILLTLRECEDLYKIYSNEYFCASWECTYDSSPEDLFKILKPVLDEVIVDRINRIETLIQQIDQYDDNKIEPMEVSIKEVIENKSK
ncbi:MAG: hypothetical protein ACRC1T_05310 [Clostridium chrysemydis]|uniref:hypothetical protein n=1 Tax=Clostridium chrysemydis TaxID=2665504 RepID=UPI003F2F5F77